jgi:hypothetical protein
VVLGWQDRRTNCCRMLALVLVLGLVRVRVRVLARVLVQLL